MKSNKQRRKEIKEKRRRKAEKDSKRVNVRSKFNYRPKNAVNANHSELQHNNTYGALPLFYVDRAFCCRDCGTDELWTAKNQKWWYEIAKGPIDSIAIHCSACRKIIQAKKRQQKQHMREMAEREPHPNEAFFRKKIVMDTNTAEV